MVLAFVVRGHLVLIDAEDEALFRRYSWRVNPDGYLLRNSRDCAQKVFARLVLGLSLGDPRQVDHINRNKLDNRRSNLRIVTPAQNSQNVPAQGGSSSHRGVTWHKGCGKWQAAAKVLGKTHYLGLFESELDAARVASEFRREHMPFSVEDAA